MEAGASTGTRTTRFMMEGVGARVIRGPEWKWGKQVRTREVNFDKRDFFETTRYSVSAGLIATNAPVLFIPCYGC